MHRSNKSCSLFTSYVYWSFLRRTRAISTTSSMTWPPLPRHHTSVMTLVISITSILEEQTCPRKTRKNTGRVCGTTPPTPLSPLLPYQGTFLIPKMARASKILPCLPVHFLLSYLKNIYFILCLEFTYSVQCPQYNLSGFSFFVVSSHTQSHVMRLGLV